jgi:hypothetical protein
MKTKAYQLDTVAPPHVLLDDENVDAARSNVLRATQDFKNSWRNLAQALQVVWKGKLYTRWGYENFDQYTAQEVHIRKHTAMKLIRSYMFLEKDEPRYLEQQNNDEDSQRRITPTLEMVNTLQRAKRALNEDEYRKVKNDILEEGKDLREVKKDLTSLIINRRKDVDPEEERTRNNKAAVTRFLLTLRTFRREIETLHILPDFIADDINALIDKIEAHTP